MNDWITDCTRNHKECPVPSRLTLPTRLVQVSPLGEPVSARLREIGIDQSEYMALSYCWGGNQLHATTKAIFQLYLRQLPYYLLPQTILDAFSVARNLGFEYIWIDSFCIVQDDVQDVTREISKMRHIYQNAQLTISAGRAATVHDGFLVKDFKPLVLYSLPSPKDEPHSSLVVSESSFMYDVLVPKSLPVNKRGWTLQEIFFSPRLLLFTDEQVFWKCQTCFRVDGYTGIDWVDWAWKAGFPRYTFKPPIWKPLERLWNWNFWKRPSQKEAHELRARWNSLVITFTERKLSVEQDKLVAIAAIAESFSSALGSKYLAGLWSKYLIYDLLWLLKEETSGQRAKTWRSPSWSWASLDGVVQPWLDPESFTPSAEIVRCSTQFVAKSIPFGGVTLGELLIRGYLRKVEFGTLYSEWIITNKSYSTERSMGYEGAKFYCDDLVEMRTLAEESRKVTAWCLSLGNVVTINHQGVKTYCLVLVKTGPSPNCYRRVGLYQAAKVAELEPNWFEHGERVVVRII